MTALDEQMHPCTQCGKPGHDFLVMIGRLPPSKTICGDCKVRIGRQLLDGFATRLAKQLTKE